MFTLGRARVHLSHVEPPEFQSCAAPLSGSLGRASLDALTRQRVAVREAPPENRSASQLAVDVSQSNRWALFVRSCAINASNFGQLCSIRPHAKPARFAMT